MMSGVHSTVWILAMSAALTSRACCRAARRSSRGTRAGAGRRWRCARAENGVEQARPIHQLSAHAGARRSATGRIARGHAVLEHELAALVRPDRIREGEGVAVHLGAVPPVRLRRGKGGGPRRSSGRRSVRSISIGCCGHGSSGERDQPGALQLVGPVAQPVVDLELDPRSREQVERRRRHEGLAGEQFQADPAGVRRKYLRRCRLPGWNVPN